MSFLSAHAPFDGNLLLHEMGLAVELHGMSGSEESGYECWMFTPIPCVLLTRVNPALIPSSRFLPSRAGGGLAVDLLS